MHILLTWILLLPAAALAQTTDAAAAPRPAGRTLVVLNKGEATASLFDPERRAWHDRLSGTRVVLLPKQPRDGVSAPE